MAKRASDLLIATVLVILTLPIILVAAVGSAVALRAWPFFVQSRVGRDGRTFRFVKIRTLPTSTPTYLLKNELSIEDTPAFTRALRRLHLDELPQLLLVITGRMSLVGPRPEMVDFHGRLDPAFADERTSVRPGCTGLWQIGEGCLGLIGESPEYDRFYLEHQSLGLDAWVLVRTAGMMLGLAQLVRLADVPEWAVGLEPAPGVLSQAPRELDFDFAEAD